MSAPAWLPDWSGEVCVIIGAGPSAGSAPLEHARGRARVIAINQSVRLAPWADLLYAADSRFWTLGAGFPEFAGLKVCGEPRAAQDFAGVVALSIRRGCDRIVTDTPGVVGWGGNSGFHAVNLAVQLGVRRILLVGFDMSVASGVHWHGKHERPLNNPNERSIERWRRILDGVALDLAGLGVGVINCSPISALTAYAVMTLDEALELAPPGASAPVEPLEAAAA